MADARSLLRAKRQEARVSHPLASYNAAGQLRCIICGTLVKFASAWEGHLGSKAHRINVARVKEEERLRDEARAREEAAAEEEEKAGQKRKAQAVEDDEDEESDSTSASKKPKLDGTPGFPADFFSDPSRAPVTGANSDDEEEQQPPAPAQPPSAIDLEYERFQKELLQTQETDARETYERATVAAEPELMPEVPEGFPVPAGAASETKEEKPELTEEEKRQQKEIEEKELIMDRLLDEERAQEEVDMKVQMMKNRLDAFKKQREVARAAKAAKKASWWVYYFYTCSNKMIHRLCLETTLQLPLSLFLLINPATSTNPFLAYGTS